MSTTGNLRKAIQKELASIEKTEAKLSKKANKSTASYIDKILTQLPKGIYSTLQSSFSKAFGIIFKYGIGIIEKGYDKSHIAAEFDIQNYAIDKRGCRKELKKLKRSAQKSDFLNMSITTVEGVGLGVLGIGLPDILIFVGMILKGVYEVSLRYGYEYDSAKEKYFMLAMMKTALSKGENWNTFNKEVDDLLLSSATIGDEVLKSKMEETAKAFADEMLLLKFVQGMPVVGVVGGVFNPIYYNKILKYVRLKYHKRYLLDKLNLL